MVTSERSSREEITSCAIFRLPPPSKTPNQDLLPLSASGFFSQTLEVTPSRSSTAFRVYLTPPNPSKPANLSIPPTSRPSPLHAGPSGTSSRATRTRRLTREGDKGKGTYLVCHHGTGAIRLSFAALAKEATEKSGGEMGVLTYDARGYGEWVRSFRNGIQAGAVVGRCR
jgi:protein phosphatase methylesterase 1